MTESLPAAISWVKTLLTGDVATSIAIIAVAALAFLAMTGDVSWRRGGTIVVGCFILFSASELSTALAEALPAVERPAEQMFALPSTAQRPQSAPPQTPYDPYAGAALPSRPIESGDLLPAGS